MRLVGDLLAGFSMPPNPATLTPPPIAAPAAVEDQFVVHNQSSRQRLERAIQLHNIRYQEDITRQIRGGVIVTIRGLFDLYIAAARRPPETDATAAIKRDNRVHCHQWGLIDGQWLETSYALIAAYGHKAKSKAKTVKRHMTLLIEELEIVQLRPNKVFGNNAQFSLPPEWLAYDLAPPPRPRWQPGQALVKS